MQNFPTPKNSILRLISFLTFITFTSTNLVYAVPSEALSLLQPQEVRIPQLAEKIEIPEILGSVKERFASPHSAATVIHIEDAHGSYEAQTHIEKILTHLQKEYGVELVQIEGGLEEMDGDLLRKFKEPWANRELAELLAKDGILNGADLFLLSDAERAHETKSKKVSAYGVEELKPYQQGIQAFAKVYKHEAKSQAFLTKMKERISSQGSRVFNPKLKSFAREWLFFQDVPSEFMRHLKTLQKYADRELQIDFLKPETQSKWPMLVRFYKLEDLQHKVNAKAVSEDFQKLLKWIGNHSGNDVMDLMKTYTPAKGFSKNDFSGTRSLLERFYDAGSKQGFRYQDYPELSKEWGSLILREEISAADLFKEVETLTRQLLEHLAKTEEEKSLIAHYEDYQLLRKALALQLTPQDYEAVKKRQKELMPSTLAAQLSLKNNLLNTLDQTFRHALDFYVLAKQRDGIIFQNAISRMKSENKPVTALVAGGFHTEGIAEQSKTKNISYVSITPHIGQITEDKHYAKLMMLAGRNDEGFFGPRTMPRQFNENLPGNDLPKNSEYAIPHTLVEKRSELRAAFPEFVRYETGMTNNYAKRPSQQGAVKRLELRNHSQASQIIAAFIPPELNRMEYKNEGIVTRHVQSLLAANLVTQGISPEEAKQIIAKIKIEKKLQGDKWKVNLKLLNPTKDQDKGSPVSPSIETISEDVLKRAEEVVKELPLYQLVKKKYNALAGKSDMVHFNPEGLLEDHAASVDTIGAHWDILINAKQADQFVRTQIRTRIKQKYPELSDEDISKILNAIAIPWTESELYYEAQPAPRKIIVRYSAIYKLKIAENVKGVKVIGGSDVIDYIKVQLPHDLFKDRENLHTKIKNILGEFAEFFDPGRVFVLKRGETVKEYSVELRFYGYDAATLNVKRNLGSQKRPSFALQPKNVQSFSVAAKVLSAGLMGLTIALTGLFLWNRSQIKIIRPNPKDSIVREYIEIPIIAEEENSKAKKPARKESADFLKEGEISLQHPPGSQARVEKVLLNNKNGLWIAYRNTQQADQGLVIEFKFQEPVYLDRESKLFLYTASSAEMKSIENLPRPENGTLNAKALAVQIRFAGSSAWQEPVISNRPISMDQIRFIDLNLSEAGTVDGVRILFPKNVSEAHFVIKSLSVARSEARSEKVVQIIHGDLRSELREASPQVIASAPRTTGFAEYFEKKPNEISEKTLNEIQIEWDLKSNDASEKLGAFMNEIALNPTFPRVAILQNWSLRPETNPIILESIKQTLISITANSQTADFISDGQSLQDYARQVLKNIDDWQAWNEQNPAWDFKNFLRRTMIWVLEFVYKLLQPQQVIEDVHSQGESRFEARSEVSADNFERFKSDLTRNRHLEKKIYQLLQNYYLLQPNKNPPHELRTILNFPPMVLNFVKYAQKSTPDNDEKELLSLFFQGLLSINLAKEDGALDLEEYQRIMRIGFNDKDIKKLSTQFDKTVVLSAIEGEIDGKKQDSDVFKAIQEMIPEAYRSDIWYWIRLHEIIGIFNVNLENRGNQENTILVKYFYKFQTRLAPHEIQAVQWMIDSAGLNLTLDEAMTRVKAVKDIFQNKTLTYDHIKVIQEMTEALKKSYGFDANLETQILKSLAGLILLNSAPSSASFPTHRELETAFGHLAVIAERKMIKRKESIDENSIEKLFQLVTGPSGLSAMKILKDLLEPAENVRQAIDANAPVIQQLEQIKPVRQENQAFWTELISEVKKKFDQRKVKPLYELIKTAFVENDLGRHVVTDDLVGLIYMTRNEYLSDENAAKRIAAIRQGYENARKNDIFLFQSIAENIAANYTNPWGSEKEDLDFLTNLARIGALAARSESRKNKNLSKRKKTLRDYQRKILRNFKIDIASLPALLMWSFFIVGLLIAFGYFPPPSVNKPPQDLPPMPAEENSNKPDKENPEAKLPVIPDNIREDSSKSGYEISHDTSQAAVHQTAARPAEGIFEAEKARLMNEAKINRVLFEAAPELYPLPEENNFDWSSLLTHSAAVPHQNIRLAVDFDDLPQLNNEMIQVLVHVMARNKFIHLLLRVPGAQPQKFEQDFTRAVLKRRAQLGIISRGVNIQIRPVFEDRFVEKFADPRNSRFGFYSFNAEALKLLENYPDILRVRDNVLRTEEAEALLSFINTLLERSVLPPGVQMASDIMSLPENLQIMALARKLVSRAA